MKSLRIVWTAMLAFTLSIPQAYAGPAEDARSYVESTKQGARDKARMIFHQYIEEAAIQTSEVVGFADHFNALNAQLASQNSDLEKFRLKLAQAIDKTDAVSDPANLDHLAEKVESLYTTTSDLYVSARAAEKSRDYMILKNGQMANKINEAFAAFLENIQKTCDNGIAVNFEYPELPPIRPVLPSYYFGVNVGVDGGGHVSASPQTPSVQTRRFNGDPATATYAAATAGGYILGAYLITGKVILTATAAQAMTATAALGATGVGLAAAAVVALVVYFDGLFDAIEQSRAVSDALWIVHNEKADAETVRGEFKLICKPFAERTAKIQERVTAIEANEPKALAEIARDRENVREAQTKLIALQKGLDGRLATLRKTIDGEESFAKFSNEAKQSESVMRLGETQEYRDMQSFIKDSKSDYLMEMFEVALIDLRLHITDVEKVMQSEYKDLFKRQTKQHLAKILKLAVLSRQMAVPQAVKDLIEAEVKASRKIVGLYNEFDSSFADYVRAELTYGQNDATKLRLVQWMEHVRNAQADLPASEALKVLVGRGDSLLKFIGAK